MANQEHLENLLEGPDHWNKWIGANHEKAPKIDLRGADLRNADLRGADLSQADLGHADLSRANLIEAYLIQTTLTNANLTHADLIRANLSMVDLTEADLSWADLTEANLYGANLRGADLKRANLNGAHLYGADFLKVKAGWTNFGDINLSMVKGLDCISHSAPSTIGIDTLYRSGGKISEAFLRGAGVPDSFVSYVSSLVGQPIDFYSCFISYSTSDQPFAERLYADLQAKGVRCWFAPHNVTGGKKLHEQIDEAIRHYELLLLILSEHSMRSEWVKTEIARARRREIREDRRMLFPIRLVDFNTLRDWECFDADTGKDSAREIREYFIPDFSRWKEHDFYREALGRLLRDLKLESAVPNP